MTFFTLCSISINTTFFKYCRAFFQYFSSHFLSQCFGDIKTKGESLLFFELKIFDSGGLFKTSRIKKNSKELTFSSNVSHHSLSHKTLIRTHNLERRTHTHSHTQSSSGTIIPFKLRSLREKKVSC